MLEVTFVFGKLLNTSLYTMFLVYPCSLLKSLDKTTYKWPLLGDTTIQGIGTFVLILEPIIIFAMQHMILYINFYNT